MAVLITNQATLNYNFNGNTGTAISNVASTVLQGSTELSKSSLSTTYGANGELTYMISVTNSGEAPINNTVVADDLGSFELAGGETVTPLSYVGPATLYINGVYESAITPVIAADSVVFTIPAIPAGGTAQILYLVRVNGNAPLATGSVITNTATSADGVSDSHTLTVENYADVRILKSMSPNPVSTGGVLTYTFDIYNYGNTDATNVVLTDTFDPAPADITVTVNGTTADPSDYTYLVGTLTLPADGGTTITVPAATMTADTTTGAVTTVPGSVTITVEGTI